MGDRTYSNSIILTRVADGESAGSYIIETNYDEILKFKPSDSELSFIPSSVSFCLKDLSNFEAVQSFTSWSFGYLNDNEEFEEFEEIASVEENKTTTVLGSFYVQDDQGNHYLNSASDPTSFTKLFLDMNKLYNSVKNAGDNLKYLRSCMEGNSAVFCFAARKDKYTIIKYLSLKNGVSGNMANLSINADSIYAAIRDHFLEFNDQGLILTNGDIKIVQHKYEIDTGVTADNFNEKKPYVLDSNNTYTLAESFQDNKQYFTKEEVEVFKTERDNGNLTITGTIYATGGSFTGTINAEAGLFSGEIRAGEGTIGGFNINENRLVSPNGEIELDSRGKITAQNIDLGGGARITDKIVFSSDQDGKIISALYNPEKLENEGKILEASKVILTNEGRLAIGNMEIFGGTGKLDGYMRSTNVDQNGQTQNGFWRINEDGTSSFDTIYANNVHLQDSVLEINTIQSVGSTMVFKDAWTIEEVQTSGKIRLDKLANLEQNEYVMVDDKVYKVNEVSNFENKKTIFTVYTDNPDMKPGQVVMKIGDVSGDCIISIKGNNQQVQNNVSNFSSPYGLAFSSFINVGSDNSPRLEYTKHLILGRLNDSGIDDLAGITGYGLYADNVYLNGSLTTKNEQGTYAGINSLNDVTFNKRYGDNSSIVIWGGAPSIDDIQDAKFQVSAAGTLYAQNAIIENSTVVGGILEAAEIKTAKIYGGGGQPSLEIHDAINGIAFYATEENSDVAQEVFRIGQYGLSMNDKYFINLQEGKPSFIGSLSDEGTTFAAQYDSGGISFTGLEAMKIYPDLDANEHYLSFLIGSGETQMKIKKDLVNISTELRIDNRVVYGKQENGTYSMRQEKKTQNDGQIVGYDIYIY